MAGRAAIMHGMHVTFAVAACFSLVALAVIAGMVRRPAAPAPAERDDEAEGSPEPALADAA